MFTGIFCCLFVFIVLGDEPSCLPVGWGDKDRHIPSVDDTKKCLLVSKPSKFVALLTKVVVGLPNAGRCGGGPGGCGLGRLKSYDAAARKYGTDWPPFGICFFTMNLHLNGKLI